MANILKTKKQVMAISALAEGMSIRAVERMTGIHPDTIMRLGAKVGNACAVLMDNTMHDLNSQRVQLDEICGFIGKKQGHLTDYDSDDLGDAYTFVAIDADTKVVPCFRVGKRDKETAGAYCGGL